MLLSACESDYVLIFAHRHFHKSFALTFNYIDLPADKQTVSASVKVGDDNDSIVSSVNYNLEEFKERLNSFNKFLTSGDLKQSQKDIVVAEFGKIFLDKKLDQSLEISALKESVIEIEQNLSEKYDLENKKKSRKVKEEKLLEVLKEISVELENCDEQKLLKKLKEEVAKLGSQLKEKKDKLMEKNKVSKAKKEIAILTKDIVDGESEIHNAVEQKFAESNKQVAKKARKM